MCWDNAYLCWRLHKTRKVLDAFVAVRGSDNVLSVRFALDCRVVAEAAEVPRRTAPRAAKDFGIRIDDVGVGRPQRREHCDQRVHD
jgi:hypothetical protein